MASNVRDRIKMIRSLIYIFALIGLAYVLFLVYFTVGPMSHCEVIDIRMAMSPTKLHVAKLEIEKCNDKNDPVIQLIISEQFKPKQSRSVTIGDATTTDLDLTWLTPNELQVAYPSSLKLTQEPTDILGVKIVFITKPISNTSFERGGERARRPST